MDSPLFHHPIDVDVWEPSGKSNPDELEWVILEIIGKNNNFDRCISHFFFPGLTLKDQETLLKTHLRLCNWIWTMEKGITSDYFWLRSRIE